MNAATLTGLMRATRPATVARDSMAIAVNRGDVADTIRALRECLPGVCVVAGRDDAAGADLVIRVWSRDDLEGGI